MEGVDTTGHVIWPGTSALASFLQKPMLIESKSTELSFAATQTVGSYFCEKKRVLELGCGVAGIPGMLAATEFSCRSICFTDNNKEVLEQLSENLAANQIGDTPKRK